MFVKKFFHPKKISEKTVSTVTVTVVTEKQLQVVTVSEKQIRVTLQVVTVTEKQLQNRYDRYVTVFL